ncbi:hypothetical protein Cme02nite_26770 [Catellatospora methionotrophica]|uniref:Thioredoxin domain-containing protein n=1 Tax=Catellatospora methionotrophica TaxID=121620 RepID=A0A8J3L8S6_9ACTN|nr:TlpA disulfide reductase family protein [Catellatospora methionotrophica]GIG14345.1 hypothetical protein Cme02nite_26770 [Catellatospora methionotrophica]
MAAALAALLAGCTGPGATEPNEPVPQPFKACTSLTGGGSPAPAASPPAPTSSPALSSPGPSRPAGTPTTGVQDAIGPTPGGPETPIGSLPSLRATPVAPSGAAASSGPKTKTIRLPELALECMAGGDPVRLADLRGPLVINLWASWCAPCRKELPAFQRLADGGRVPVLGVVTEDSRDAAAWLADELKVSLPSVYDRSGALKAAVGENVLPITLFVGPDGTAKVYRDVALTDQTLGELVQQHFGGGKA